MTDQELEDLRIRNHARAWAARKAMGTRWLCHPANHVQRKGAPPPDQWEAKQLERALEASTGAALLDIPS